MAPIRPRALSAAFLLCAAAAAQEPCRLRVDGAIHGVRVAGPQPFAAAGNGVSAELAAGPWELHFAPGGGGRPASLAVAAPAGGSVAVAVAAPPVANESAAVLAAALHDARTFGDGDAQDVRVRVRARTRGTASGTTGGATGGTFGLTCRWQDAARCYRLAWDPARTELRLERLLGDHVLVLAKMAAPPAGDAWHELELQADGFRLQAFCDDVPIAQVMDGALSHGRYGTFTTPDAAAEFDQLTAAPPAVALASLAAITGSGRTSVVARAPAAAGGVFALCLRLDRPQPLLPSTATGFECSLLQQPAEPLLRFGFSFGAIGPRGEIEGAFAYPCATLLRGQAALVGGLLGTPDAETAAGWLPWAAVTF